MSKVNLSVLYDDLIYHKDYSSTPDMTPARIIRVFNSVQGELARIMYTADPNLFGAYTDYDAAQSATLPPTLRKLQYVEYKASGNYWAKVFPRSLRRRTGTHDTGDAPTSGTFRLNYSRRLADLSYGTAEAGADTTITLMETPTYGETSVEDDYYNGTTIEIVSGTGSGQKKAITDYVGSTRVATVAWDTAPSTDSVYNIVCDIPGDFYYDGMIWGALTRLTTNQNIEMKYFNLQSDLRAHARREEQSYPSMAKVDEHSHGTYYFYIRGQTIYFYVA